MAALREAHQYRELAEDNRRRAEATQSDPLLSRSYSNLAASYDKLADTMEGHFADFPRAHPD
jgi:hypothetical protein